MFGLSTLTGLLCLATWLTCSHGAIQGDKDNKEMKAIPVRSLLYL